MNLSDDEEEDEVGVEDPVPELLPRHFELSMEHARRSVSDSDIARYQQFQQNFSSNKLTEATTGTKFKFPTVDETAAAEINEAANEIEYNNLVEGVESDDEDLYD